MFISNVSFRNGKKCIFFYIKTYFWLCNIFFNKNKSSLSMSYLTLNGLFFLGSCYNGGILQK